jgi:hypothetical protein
VEVGKFSLYRPAYLKRNTTISLDLFLVRSRYFGKCWFEHFIALIIISYKVF